MTTTFNNSHIKAIALYVTGYVTVSLGALGVLIALHGNNTEATKEAWVHGIIVAATSLLMALFARGAMQGKKRAYLRLRITSAIMIVAIAVTTAIPDDFPIWMKVEQVFCALLLIGLAITLNRRDTKAVYKAK